ncbi:MAG TPA: energy transducer TonB [Polyangiaceae bacterium]|nr:energy transducer TonB [Polyangiaceae bacterium]
MSREPHIPLFLWIALALVIHVTGQEGATRVSDAIGERIDVQRFADAVRRHVLSTTRPMEVALVEDPTLDAQKDQEHPDESTPDDEARPADEPSPTKVDATKSLTKREDPKVKPPEEREAEKKPKPPELKKQAEQKPPEQKPPPEKRADLPKVEVKNRIAVQQHVEDRNQADNPNAEFIGDEANTVREQTQARISSTDQNDPDPSPGTAHDGPSDEPGNAHVNDVAHSEDSPGAIDHAPNSEAAGQKATQSTDQAHGGSQKMVQEVAPDSRKGRSTGEMKGSNQSPPDQKKQDERIAVAGSRARPEAPDLMNSRNGTDLAPEAQEGHVARAAEKARPKRLPPMRGAPNALDFLGLGASGTTPGGINLNLTPGDAYAAVGRDQLGRERVADGERRLSKHRGSWKTVGIERWRAAIENYNSSVKPGNQTALNTARVPFATYLNQIHNRLHPIFADSFLGSLDGLPSSNPLSNPDMKTNLEIVLDKEEGKIVKMGVTRSSGSTVFDIAALESVQNAAPFGKPPPIIVSPDGNVYLHWEFYRNPYYACSTYFAHPFILKASPESAPPRPPAPPATPEPGPTEQTGPARGDLGRLSPTRGESWASR